MTTINAKMETQEQPAATTRRPPLTPKNHAKKHGWPDGGIRHLLFNRKDNGLEQCVISVGRKLLIKQDCWDSWLENQKEA